MGIQIHSAVFSMSKVSIDVLDYEYTSGCKFYASYESTETFIVQVIPNNEFELFSHQNQTDQLILVNGSCNLIWIENEKFKSYTLHSNSPLVVTIPPNIWHGTLNHTTKPCTIVNALIRHAPPAENDYVPKKLEDLSLKQQEQYDTLLKILKFSA